MLSHCTLTQVAIILVQTDTMSAKISLTQWGKKEKASVTTQGATRTQSMDIIGFSHLPLLLLDAANMTDLVPSPETPNNMVALSPLHKLYLIKPQHRHPWMEIETCRHTPSPYSLRKTKTGMCIDLKAFYKAELQSLKTAAYTGQIGHFRVQNLYNTAATITVRSFAPWTYALT